MWEGLGVHSERWEDLGEGLCHFLVRVDQLVRWLAIYGNKSAKAHLRRMKVLP